ncbi:hypothetical protein J6590_005664 [Homalodisca vitripennis]|nr:hypothetical protein J6590_005664 [Homalodisca vitripennis]
MYEYIGAILIFGTSKRTHNKAKQSVGGLAGYHGSTGVCRAVRLAALPVGLKGSLSSLSWSTQMGQAICVHGPAGRLIVVRSLGASLRHHLLANSVSARVSESSPGPFNFLLY